MGVDSGLLLDANALTEYVMRLGFRKAHLSLPKMIVLGWLAGMYVAIGAQTLCAVLTDVASNGPTKILGGAFFAVALMCIVVCGAELFTGNVMLMIAVCSRRLYLWEWIYDLTLVFFSNFLGCITFAVLIWGGGVNGFDGDYSSTGKVVCSLATHKALLPAYQSFLRGIGANICVCLGVLLAYASKTPSGKVLGCVFPIACFVAIGWEHCIANQYLFSAATLLQCPEFTQHYAWSRLFLSTAGNIVGALILSFSYWFVNIHGSSLELAAVPHRKELSILKRSSLPDEEKIYVSSSEPIKEEIKSAK